jgi:hypothetical protein
VKIVTNWVAGLARKRLGTNDQVTINAPPAINSAKKTRIFRATRT